MSCDDDRSLAELIQDAEQRVRDMKFQAEQLKYLLEKISEKTKTKGGSGLQEISPGSP